jgi:hypothetical protein
VRRTTILSVCIAIVLSSAVSVSAEPFIAGLKPWERPAGAPVITEFAKDQAWYAAALQGVDKPYPGSLKFLDDQGGWFNPFTRPGMLGLFDIRGWHQSPPANSSAN